MYCGTLTVVHVRYNASSRGTLAAQAKRVTTNVALLHKHVKEGLGVVIFPNLKQIANTAIPTACPIVVLNFVKFHLKSLITETGTRWCEWTGMKVSSLL